MHGIPIIGLLGIMYNKKTIHIICTILCIVDVFINEKISWHLRVLV